MQDSVKRFIETEHNCEVTELAIRPMGMIGEMVTGRSWKVDGCAYRNGERLIVGGTVNDHNYSGVRVWDKGDNPFADLK